MKVGKFTMVQQIVLPIKDSNILKMVQDTLLDSFRAGRRNYTIFQVIRNCNTNRIIWI